MVAAADVKKIAPSGDFFVIRVTIFCGVINVAFVI